MDQRTYWNQVRKQEADLRKSGKGPYYLVSLDHPEKGITSGRVVGMADPGYAAKLIIDRTHRLATREEIAASQQDLARRTEQLAVETLAKKQKFALPQDLQDLVRVAAESIKNQGAANEAPPKPAAEPPKEKK